MTFPMPARLRRRGSEGVVLVVALFMVMLLAVLLLEFNYEARLAAQASANHYRSLQALRAAESGVSVAKAALSDRATLIESDALQRLIAGETAIEVGEAVCRIEVTSENGRLNANKLDTAGRQARGRIDQFLRLVDIINHQYEDSAPASYAIVPSIMDWIDEDDEVTRLDFVERENEGAESDYYRGLDPPYSAKNAPLDVLEELLLVKGVTPEVFYGRRRDPESGDPATQGLRDFVTIYGDGRVDVNFAPPEVLLALSDLMEPGVAYAIAAERRLALFQSLDELLAVPGMTQEVFNAIRRFATVEPRERYYRVVSTGEAHGIRRRIEAIIKQDDGADSFSVVLRRDR